MIRGGGEAAAEIAGGNGALARRLGIGESLLAKFLGDNLQLPDPVLLKAVDIILEERLSRQRTTVLPRLAAGTRG